MHTSDAAIAGESLLSGFQEYLRSQGVTSRTRAGYGTDLRDFLRHAGDTGSGAVTAADLERYFASQAARGMRRATMRRRLAGIRRFFDYLVASGALRENPAEELVLGHDAVLCEQHILSIFRFLRLRSRQVSPRRSMAEELVLMLMMFAGLRQYHIANLLRSSVEGRNGAIHLKLPRAQSVEIDGPLLGHLQAYRRRYEHTSGRFLLSSTSVRRLLAEIAAGLGITLDNRRIRATHLWLTADPERAYGLLSRIEDIHE